ncbi:uncharacterized protein FIBRA_04569 [Fibroporia radiculosa]|uniref:F-box domain-containing protein n=1 Tax=Fibroporia radiculosa TaxID=599839 RepID=J4H312_9APHY|nr:uncharacterized protein FIBRA_04569 [Fibroporia radiculosa]CCM02469.1 predicted protein [Fibroporia radiculosa]
MPFTLKRPRRREFARSLVDAVKSMYTSDKRFSDGADPLRAHSAVHVYFHDGHRKYHPIMRLPNELLAHIFALGAEDDIMLPVVISHVCRAWRKLALHTPSLWRRVVLDSRLSMWTQRIHRAKACTLDIQLANQQMSLDRTNYIVPLDAQTVLYYMHLVIPFIPRWRSLEIKFDIYTPYLWNAALSACCDSTPAVQAHFLRELSLIYPGNDDTKEFVLFNGVAPRLRRVTLWGIRLAWYPSLFQHLTFLDYTHHGFTRGHEAASDVLQILQVSSRLEVLRLAFPWRGDSNSRYSNPSARTTTLPRLATLTLSIEGPDIPPALLHVLMHLSLPAIRTLRLVSRYPFRRPTLFPRLRHVLKALPQLPTLRHLYVEYGWLDSRFVHPLVQSLPRLQHVVLHGPQVDASFLQTLMSTLRARRSADGNWQPLRGLELVRCEAISAEDIVAAVRAQPSSISVLYLRACPRIEQAGLRKLKSSGVMVRTATAA